MLLDHPELFLGSWSRNTPGMDPYSFRSSQKANAPHKDKGGRKWQLLHSLLLISPGRKAFLRVSEVRSLRYLDMDRLKRMCLFWAFLLLSKLLFLSCIPVMKSRVPVSHASSAAWEPRSPCRRWWLLLAGCCLLVPCPGGSEPHEVIFTYDTTISSSLVVFKPGPIFCGSKKYS